MNRKRQHGTTTMNFGKILVLVNLALSLLFVTWAMALVSERMDWAPSKNSAGEEVPGKLRELQAQIADLVVARDKAEERWQAAHTVYTRAETSRIRWRDWYADQLNILEKGEDLKGVKSPVKALKYDKDGNLMMDGLENLKVLDQEAKAINGYNKRIGELYKDIYAEQDEIIKLLEEQEKLTTEVLGKEGVKLGLRHELAVAESALKSALDEQNRLEADVYTSKAEAELLKKRRLALEARVKELGGESAAAARP